MHRPVARVVVGLLLAAWLVGALDWLLSAERVPTVPMLVWTTPAGVEVLASWGVSPTGWAGFLLLLALVVVVASAAAAWLLLREPTSGFRSFTAVALVLFATAGSHVPVVVEALHPRLGEAGSLAQGVGWVALFQLAYLYPDGRFVPRWSRWAVGGWLALLLGGLAVDLAGVRGVTWDLAETVLLLVLLGSVVAAQAYRYRSVSGPVERAQTRGVFAALTLWGVLALVLLATPLGELIRRPTFGGMLAGLAVEVATTATLGLIPLAVVGGLLRRRTVVIDELGRRLGAAVLPDQVAEQLVVGVGESLRLPQVTLRGAEGLTATHRVAPADARTEGVPGTPVTFPIRYLGEDVGVLEVVPGPHGLSGRERALLAELADQAAVAVRAAATTSTLRAARQHVVRAREEERRRLHRDLHDGLGPTLASLFQRLDLAVTLTETDPATATRLVTEGRDHLREAIGDLRTVVLGLRPPALDALGLAGSLREGCHRFAESSGVTIEAEVEDLPPLPAGVEVAAYRIVMECLANVVRHAGATRCRVALRARPAELVVSVDDDGSGTDPTRGPAATGRGGGLATMRERAEEVGGSLEVRALDPHGTSVAARLPLVPGPAGDT